MDNTQETQAEAPVETGLEAFRLPQETAAPAEQASEPKVKRARKPKVEKPAEDPVDAAVTEAVEQAETKPDPAAPISFDEPISPADLTAGVGDEPESALVSAEQLAELQRLAHHDNVKHDFTKKVLAARAKQVEEPAAPPPVNDRIRAQTEAEMACGQKMNKHFEDLHARHPRPPAPEPDSKAVFRPGDYVPNPRKGQGYVAGRNL